MDDPEYRDGREKDRTRDQDCDTGSAGRVFVWCVHCDLNEDRRSRPTTADINIVSIICRCDKSAMRLPEIESPRLQSTDTCCRRIRGSCLMSQHSIHELTLTAKCCRRVRGSTALSLFFCPASFCLNHSLHKQPSSSPAPALRLPVDRVARGLRGTVRARPSRRSRSAAADRSSAAGR